MLLKWVLPPYPSKQFAHLSSQQWGDWGEGIKMQFHFKTNHQSPVPLFHYYIFILFFFPLKRYIMINLLSWYRGVIKEISIENIVLYDFRMVISDYRRQMNLLWRILTCNILKMVIYEFTKRSILFYDHVYIC